MAKKLSVIVPFLNEEENLPLLHERLVKALAGQPEELEVIYVDDGSRDSSARWVAEAARQDPRVKLIPALAQLRAPDCHHRGHGLCAGRRGGHH